MPPLASSRCRSSRSSSAGRGQQALELGGLWLLQARAQVRVPVVLALLLGLPGSAGVAPGAEPGATNPPPRAARSVHLGYPAPDAQLFHLAMVIEQSTSGSYFMAAGWDSGYFGLQELSGGRKVALFSVWDAAQGDDPKEVKAEDRVELLHQDPTARIKRFGGEGTGGQCMIDFDWKLGETNRFIVTGTVQSNKTAYAGYLWQADRKDWRHLVTFRTRTGGRPLRGLYSFVEDFRRDGKSVQEARRARYGEGWVRTTTNDWVRLARARFTASGAKWESKENINAGCADAPGWAFLITGGEVKRTRELRSLLECPLETPNQPPLLSLPE